jgi:hypothetical protein
MKTYNAVVIGLSLMILVACTTITVISERRFIPKHRGVDPEIAVYLDDWLKIGRSYGFKFKNQVTAGFNDLSSDHGTVGMSHYGVGFREIDIDPKYWLWASELQRTALIWHEAGHSYCGRREHEYGKGKIYKVKGLGINDPDQKDGYFSDGCPKTVMFPVVVDDSCMVAHYQDYLQEMFKNCQEY